MRKLIIAIMIIQMGLASYKSMSQIANMTDSAGLDQMLVNIDQLIERDLDSALILSKEVNRRSQIINYQHGIWEAMLLQGKIYKLLGHQDSAVFILNQVLSQSKRQSARLTEMKANIELSSGFGDEYNFNSAVTHLIEAEKLLKDTDSFDLRFNILNQLGMVHRKMKDYQNALRYYSILKNQFFNQLDAEQKFYLYMNTGNVFADQKDYQKTEELFNKAYNEILKIDSPANLALITYNLGALYYRQRHFNKAGEHIKESLKANLQIGNQLKIERCYRVLGAIHMDQGHYHKAEDYYYRALAIAKAIDHPKSTLGNYRNLFFNYSFLAESTGNPDYISESLKYFRLWDRLNDSLYQVENAEKILELEKQYETEKKNNQIALLEKENQIKEDEIFIQHAQRNYLIIVIILVSCIMSIFIYFFYYYKKVNRLLQVQAKRILLQKDQIVGQNKRLQKSVNTQNKLFSIIAHDLRSPLVSISNISKLISFYIQDKRYDSLEEIAKLMDQKNDAVLDLTDNLLSWAKSQTENLNPLFAPVKIKDILEECLELYQPIAEEKAISVTCCDLKDKLLWADRNMVRTICRNLINNAIKFTPKGGLINIYDEVNGPFITICIDDSGIGISPEKMEILFELDHEKVASGTEGEKSSGLGLTVCKEFVHAMKGEIWATVKPGKGSEFCFKLQLFDPDIHELKYKKSQTTKQPSRTN